MIFNIYDEIDCCYLEGGYIKGCKVFDFFYKYLGCVIKEEIYVFFKEFIDIDSLDVLDFDVNFMVLLLVDLYDVGKIEKE